MEPEFDYTCRACLKISESSPLFSLQDEETRNLFVRCTSISVSPSDELPQQLCSQCYCKCIAWSEFREQAAESELNLQSKIYTEYVEQEMYGVIQKEEETEEELDDMVEEEQDEGDEDAGILDPETIAINYETEQELVRPPTKLGEELSDGIECPYCEVLSTSYGLFKKHLIASHETGGAGESKLCPVCSETLPAHASLLNHAVKAHMNLQFNCKECDFSGANYQELKAHERISHSKGPFVCEQCGRQCATRNSLKCHENTHLESNIFTCETCGVKLKGKRSLKRHQVLHLDSLDFPCDLCEKKFKSSLFANQHRKTHLPETKRHACSHCEAKYFNSKHLEDHIRSRHTRDRPFKCPDCQWAFMKKSLLVDHQRIHSGEKAFACPECNKRFTLKKYLHQHLRTHKKRTIRGSDC